MPFLTGVQEKIADAIGELIGCNTPAEEFLRQIIDLIPDGLTPDNAEQSVDEFRENFDYMLSDCAKFARRYPKQLEQAVAEARAAQ